MTTSPITFDARLSSYCPGPILDRYTNTGWNVTLDGQNAKSGELHTARIEMHGYGVCPFNPANQDARVRVTVEILTPKTRVVPWKAEEVPLGAWVRMTGQTAVLAGITRVTRAGAYCCDACFPFDVLATSYEHSTDGGKTWKPAGRVEEVYE